MLPSADRVAAEATPTGSGPTRRFLLVVNRRSGVGRAAGRIDALLESDREVGSRCRVVEFSSLAGLREHISGRAADEVPVAVGGDGTVNAVARTLHELDLPGPIGIVPLGTGNLLAHELGLGSPAAALRVLLSGEERTLDAMVTDHPDFPLALMSISGGFEARFIHRWDTWRRRSAAAAMLAGAGAFLGRGCRSLALAIDDETIAQSGELVWSAGLYLMRRYAFGRVVLPDADPSDGYGEAVVYRTRAAYVAALSRGLRSGSGRGDATCRPCKRARISAPEGLQIDGEPVAGCTLTAVVLSGALCVIAPEGPGWATGPSHAVRSRDGGPVRRA